MGKRACPKRDALIRRLYEAGETHAAIAAAVGTSKGAIGGAVSRMGLPPRRTRATVAADRRRAAEAEAKRQQEVPAPRPALEVPDWTVDRDARLVASRGRYAELSGLADRWGMPMRRVMARYHAVRP